MDESDADMLTPADLMNLPIGQAFAVWGGGQLHKIRLPMAGKDPLFPKDMQAIRRWTADKYGMEQAA